MNRAGRGGRTIASVKCCQEDPHQLHVSKGSYRTAVKAKCFNLNAALISLEEQTAVRICTKTAAKYSHELTSPNIRVADTGDFEYAVQIRTTSKADLNEH